MTDALFGMFLQDVREIEKRNPRCFRNHYYRYSFEVSGEEKFALVIEPASLPKNIEQEIRSSFQARLNGDGRKHVMKKILVATDFSDTSGNAARYGVEMAVGLNARVILFNAYQQAPVPIADSLVVATLQDMKRAVQEQLEREADEITGEKAVPVEILAKEGPTVEMILDAAREVEADLIIAGVKGGHKAVRRMLGSTVTALAQKTTIPLLIVPGKVAYSSPRAIALANDITPEADAHLLEALRSVAETSHPKFYIVRVIKEGADDVVEVVNWPLALQETVAALDPVYEYRFDNNVTRALTDFIASHQVDMLAMVPHRHSLLEKMFHRSNTKSAILHAKIPLLILPDISPDHQWGTG